MQGIKDLFYQDLEIRNWICEHILKFLYSYGYLEIQTPIMEERDLFFRSVGESSDIMEKELYTLDSLRPKISLRPEGTAGVVRAIFRNKLFYSGQDFIKVFYRGSMFRHNRPQKGRLREFMQIGGEFFGIKEPIAEIEVLAMVHQFLKKLPIGDFVLEINTLGNKEERKIYIELLFKYFEGNIVHLCKECQSRLFKSVLRVLDCKHEKCKRLVLTAPSLLDNLGRESLSHFDIILNGLMELGVPYVVNRNLVRGLEYYTRTVFEFLSTDGLGAQNSIVGGGRYDNLVNIIAGEDVPALGFAVGVDRLEMLIKKNSINFLEKRPDLSIIYADEYGKQQVLKWLINLRSSGKWIDCDYRDVSVRAKMRRANRIKSKKVIIIGEDEIKKKIAIIKDMDMHSEEAWDMKKSLLEMI
ncbi:MAG: histidine--tRNA ligase [Deltaproteobacteria bacterium]|nr:MAG: histidine--tRNA ligase [Deltaproteobacteria bacterium]